MGTTKTIIKRGDVWIADLPTNAIGSVQKGERPVLIMQNSMGNIHSETVIVVCITSKIKKMELPVHIELLEDFLPQDSIVLGEQIMTISKEQLISKLGRISMENQKKVDEIVKISLELLT